MKPTIVRRRLLAAESRRRRHPARALLLASLGIFWTALGPAPAAQVVADFNDMNLGDMRQAVGQPPGTGVGFTGDYWVANTGTQLIGSGDLAVTTTGYNVTQGGTPQSMYTNNTAARMQGRDCVDLAGTVWMSFLVSKPTTAGRAGVGFNRPLTPDAAGYTASDPRIVWLDEQMQLRVGNAVAGFAPLTSTASTVLIVARIRIDAGAAGEDFVDVWVNPANVTTEAAMGAASFSVTNSNFITAGVITSIHPQVYNATGTSTPKLDSLRLSDGIDGFAFVTGNAAPRDPDFRQDSGQSANPDFVFGVAIDTPVPSLLPVTRSLTFTNFGATKSITVRSVTLANNSVFTVTPSLTLPATLGPGQSIDVEVALATPPGNGSFTTTLTIDTDDDLLDPKQDLTRPVSATYLVTGSNLLTNGNFENADFNFGWDNTGSAFGPLAPGSTKAAKTAPATNLRQNFAPATGDDFEVSFYFAVEQIPIPGDSNRNFNVRLVSGGSTTSIVNLGYCPDGASGSGKAGFYIYTTAWQPVIFDNGDPLTGTAVTLQNSLDNNGDGDYDDAAEGDVKNVYFMRIVAADWGIGGYGSYDVYLHDINGNQLGLSKGLTFYQNTNLNAATPVAVTFATDFGNNPGFVVDDVVAVNSKDDGFGFPLATNPDLQVAIEPDFGINVDPAGPLTRKLVLRNSGAAGSSLNVSGIAFSDSHYSLVSALPGALAAGQSAALDVRFDPGTDRGLFPCTVSIASNDPLNATEKLKLTAAAWNSGDVVNANCDFEATPFDSGWQNAGATLAAGLAGAQAAFVAPGGKTLSQGVVVGGNWEFECLLAVQSSAPANRTFTLIVTSSLAGASGPATLGIRYGEGYAGFSVFGNGNWQPMPSLGTLLPSVDGDLDGSLDHPGSGDVANVYRLKLVGRNWGAGAGMASYDILVSDANSTIFRRAATDLRLIQNGNLDTDLPNGFRFDTAFGNNPGFWVDNACFKAGAPAADDPNLIVAAAPAWIQLLNGSPADADLQLSNTGGAGLLTVTGISFSGNHAANFAVAPGTSFPLQVGAGTGATVPIRFTKGASPGGTFTATLEIASNDATDAALGITRQVPVSVSAYDFGDLVLTNGNFEATPFNAGWATTGEAIVNGGLNIAGGSTQCANLSTADDRIVQGPPFGQENFTVECYFALSTIGSRTLNFRLYGTADGSGTEIINLKYEGGNLQAFNTAWQPLVTSAGLLPSFDFDGSGTLGDHPSDIRNVYRLRFTGRGFGTAGASYDVALLQENGTPIGQATGQTIWLPATPATVNQARAVAFNTNNGAAPFWVDDVRYTFDNPAAVSDYDSWAAGYGLDPATTGAPGVDHDGDGLTNSAEYAFGLDPTKGSPVSPLRVPLDKATGTFTYTRRNPGLMTGLNYSYESSTTLEGTWDPLTPSAVSSDNASPVETVTVTVPAGLLTSPRLFVRVLAN